MKKINKMIEINDTFDFQKEIETLDMEKINIFYQILLQKLVIDTQYNYKDVKEYFEKERLRFKENGFSDDKDMYDIIEEGLSIGDYKEGNLVFDVHNNITDIKIWQLYQVSSRMDEIKNNSNLIQKDEQENVNTVKKSTKKNKKIKNIK